MTGTADLTAALDSDPLASVAMDARALDAKGTITDSSQEALPNMPARSHFDYLDCLGYARGSATAVSS
jgi:hypothetical protein